MTSKIAFYLSLSLFFSAINASVAQEFSEWGKVTEEELNGSDIDASTDAIILLSLGKIEVEGDDYFSFKYYKRVKILKRAGFELGTVTIPFLSEKDAERLISCKAQITHPSGKTIQLADKDFFTERTNKYLTTHKINFPQIEIGSVLEYTFELKSKSFATLKDWYFQSSIPIKKSKLELNLASHFKYDFHQQGPPLDTATVNGKSFSTDRNDTNYSHGFAGMVNNYVFIRQNVPALQTVPHVHNMNNHYERIKFRLSQMPIGDRVARLSHNNWFPLVKALTNDNQFGWQYKTKGYFKNVLNAVKPLVKGIKNKEEQLSIIYRYLLDNINLVEKRGLLVEKSLNTCFKEKQASSIELNLMLIALAKNLKIGESAPMAISTREHGKTMEDYPFLDQFDHILAYIELPDKVILLDATDPYLPMGYPAIQSANKRGLLIRPLARWKDISIPMSSTTFKGDFVMDEDGNLTGKIKVNYEGYKASEARTAFAKDVTGSLWAKQLEDKYLDFNLLKVEAVNQAAINQPLEVTASLEITEIGQRTDDYFYFNPLFYLNQEKNPFQQTDRIIPIDFPYPYTEQQQITIRIPDNYEIVGTPELQKMTIEDIGHFEYTVRTEDQNILLSYTFQIPQTTIAPTSYHQLRDFFDKLVENTQELVTLKRKAE